MGVTAVMLLWPLTATCYAPSDEMLAAVVVGLLTDASGIPLVLQLTAANQNDVKTLLPLVVELPAVAGKPGHPKQKPEKLVADKGFDCEPLRDLLRWLGIEPVLPKRGNDDHGLGPARRTACAPRRFARAVVAPQERLNHRFQFRGVTLAFHFQLPGGFFANASDERLALGKKLPPLFDDEPLQERRIIRQRGRVKKRCVER